MLFLKERGLIALATAPGNDKVSAIVGDETLGEDDPLLAQLLAAATAGLPPAGPAQRRAPLRMALSANDKPKSKGRLCAEQWGFNLHAATRVHGKDKQGREHLCRYILRPPLGHLRLMALAKEQATIAKILGAMGLAQAAASCRRTRAPSSRGAGWVLLSSAACGAFLVS